MRSFEQMHNDYLDPDRHMAGMEAEAIGEMVEAMKTALKESGLEGRNHECWPILSFGWKDADLNPEGCTGIECVASANEENVTLKVGGHKRVCDPTYESEYDLSDEDKEEFSNVAQEIVNGAPFPGEWEGDDWCLHYSTKIKVEWPAGNPSTKRWKKSIVSRVIKAAKKALKHYREEMALMSDAMDSLWKEVREKYESK